MRILFVTNGYPTKNNPEYCVFTKEQIVSVLKTKEVEGKLFFINVRENGLIEYLKAIPKLRKEIKHYDIVHAFHGLSFLLVVMIAPSKKIIVSFLNSIKNEYGEKQILVKPLVFFTELFVKKKNVHKIFKDKIPKKFARRSYYLPNGVDIARFYPLERKEAKRFLGLDTNKKYILFVSSKDQYRKQKRYDRFVKTLEILRMKFNDIEELILVNEPRDRILYYFNAAELHLLTSDFEGSPNSVKESIACNTPVVSTRVGNVDEMIGDIENCYVSDSFDEVELAENCEKILLAAPVENIRKYIYLKSLDMNSKAEELVELYKNININ